MKLVMRIMTEPKDFEALVAAARARLDQDWRPKEELLMEIRTEIVLLMTGKIQQLVGTALKQYIDEVDERFTEAFK